MNRNNIAGSYADIHSLKRETKKSLVIDGVDINRGISMTGGTLEGYRNALTMYCRDGYEKIKQIEESLRNNDMQLFASHFHFLKNASAGIGAVRISGAAENLELAGLSGDMEFVLWQTHIFLTELNKTLQCIDDALII